MENYEEVVAKAKEWAESSTYDDRVDMYLMWEADNQAYVKICDALGVRKYMEGPIDAIRRLKEQAEVAQ